jgi:hypothetical protein
MLSLIDEVRRARGRHVRQRVRRPDNPSTQVRLSPHAAGGCTEHETSVRAFLRSSAFSYTRVLGRRLKVVPAGDLPVQRSVGKFCLPIPTWARSISAVGFRARASEQDVGRTILSHRTAERDLGYSATGLVACMAIIRSAVALAALPSRSW